jgi:dTDP-glucose 4,6-dehydratase
MQKTLLITGGAGFIGSHVIRRFLHAFPDHQIVNLDKLTYAGNLENLLDVQDNNNYVFVKGDINDEELLQQLFSRYDFEGVVHLAAESHVDRSITNPLEFVRTNVLGTVNLLNAARTQWGTDMGGRRFYHVSTDEVYGTLGAEGLFTESTPYDPRSPYSASKASSDHFVRAWFHTYGLPVVISNCSNNYGANQFPEKLLPLAIHNIQHQKPVPIYGDGKYTRDWLWVNDHARAIEVVYKLGVIGETYNIGGFNEWQNIDLIHVLCRVMDKKLGRADGDSAKLITFVKDRPGHDKRYAIDATRIATELGWKPSVTFEEGLAITVDWYLENGQWLEHVTSGAYQQYYQDQHTSR